MKSIPLGLKCALVVLVGAMLTAGAATADNPSHNGAGKSGKSAGKGGKYERDERADRREDQSGGRRDVDDRSRHDRDGGSTGKRGHFEERQQVLVREYYGEQFRGGRCPPGLAKKNNGCMPPGQAKKWKVGRPLPRDVIYYTVPQALVVQIGMPPSGHRYVRVASDILMIAIGTGMVVDAIQDLGR